MNEFNNGSHEGDSISQMENDTLIFELMIFNKYSKDTVDIDKKKYFKELINELDFRMRSDEINIDSENNLNFILSLDNKQLFTAFCEISSDYSSDILFNILDNSSFEQESAINFFNHYLAYYKNNENQAPQAFYSLYSKFKNSKYQLNILEHLDDYLLKNVNLALKLKNENILDREHIIKFIGQNKTDIYYNEAKKEAAEYFILQLEPSYWNIDDNLEQFLYKNSRMAYCLKQYVDKENSIFKLEIFKNFLINLQTKAPEGIFSLFPESIRVNREYMERFHIKFPLFKIENLHPTLKKDDNFLLTILLYSSSNSFSTFQNMDKNKIANFITFCADFCYPFIQKDVYQSTFVKSKNKSKEYKELEEHYLSKYPLINLNYSQYNLSQNAVNLLSDLNHVVSKILDGMELPIQTKLKIFEGLYKTDIKKSYYFFEENNLDSYYKNNLKNDINFLQLFCHHSNDETFSTLKPIIHHQIMNIITNNHPLNIEPTLNQYLSIKNNHRLYVNDKYLFDLLKVIPTNTLNSINNNLSFSLLNCIIVKDEKNNIINNEDFLSHLKTHSFEYELLNTAPKQNNNKKAIKF